jgi:hypothetical protein
MPKVPVYEAKKELAPFEFKLPMRRKKSLHPLSLNFHLKSIEVR